MTDQRSTPKLYSDSFGQFMRQWHDLQCAQPDANIVVVAGLACFRAGKIAVGCYAGEAGEARPPIPGVALDHLEGAKPGDIWQQHPVGKFNGQKDRHPGDTYLWIISTLFGKPAVEAIERIYPGGPIRIPGPRQEGSPKIFVPLIGRIDREVPLTRGPALASASWITAHCAAGLFKSQRENDQTAGLGVRNTRVLRSMSIIVRTLPPGSPAARAAGLWPEVTRP